MACVVNTSPFAVGFPLEIWCVVLGWHPPSWLHPHRPAAECQHGGSDGSGISIKQAAVYMQIRLQ